MFFGWEGVGLASYLLIGFWYQKPSANAAAIKAFVVNRVGDFGFSLGIFGTFLVFGTVNINEILAAAPTMTGTFGFLGMRVDIMTTLCLLLFVGAMGKSAQLGPSHLAAGRDGGPTPVSALIHAATMVTRACSWSAACRRMFEQSGTALAGRDVRRRSDGVVRCDGRHRADRHQARDRLFDVQPARLHVHGRGRRAPIRLRCSTSSRTPSSRRCCSWAQGSVIMPCIMSRTCGSTGAFGSRSR
jgi:hypothetical protein